MKELVTAAVTTYKRAPEMVCRAVKSILNQTYPTMEIIVVDDSPADYPLRDEVKQAVLSFSPAINFIQHEKNQGACAARNTALQQAKGVYIAYLDDDDEWLPEKIEKQLAGFDSADTALVYCGNHIRKSEAGSEYIEKRSFYRGDVYSKLIWQNFIGSTSFPLLRVQFLREIGGFDVLMQSAQDYDVWLKLTRKYRVNYIEEPLVVYYEHEGEQISKKPKAKIQGLEELNERHREIIEADRALWARRHSVIIPYYVQDGQVRKALREWFHCVLKTPGKVLVNGRLLCQIIKYGLKRS